MTLRLKTICSLITRTASFIDVGCDHGYVVKYVADNGLAESIAACDISEPSLDKARALLGKDCGVRFYCGDGADCARGYDTVLISGMGGLETVHIIRGCTPNVFILSPQSHVYEVRKTLLIRDYKIVEDKVIYDGKYYDVIKAKLGGGTNQLDSADELQLKYGMNLRQKNEDLKNRLEAMLASVTKFPQTEENACKRKEIEEALLWQSR